MPNISPLALIENPNAAESHWRILRPYLRMRQAGINAQAAWGDNVSIPTDPNETVLVVPQMTSPDIETAREWLDARRPMVKAIVYETDDDTFTEDRIEHLRAADFLQGRTLNEIRREQEVARWFVDQCDGVTVTTEPLAAVVRSFTDKPVCVVPNALDVRWFRAHLAYRPPWADILTIGYAGGRRAERDLVPMARAWGRIAERYPDVRFVIATPTTPTVLYRYVPENRFIRLGWLGLEDYPLAYQVDIGCCSVVDNAFNRCRSPIKSWEYSVAGAAVVATPTLYGECIDSDDLHGTGLLASTADKWEWMLNHYIEYPDARQFYGSHLREHVEQHHNLDTELHRWMDAYGAIVDAKNEVAV